VNALRRQITTHGPLTVARFMELALYDPEHGYYARAAQRSGRMGDFYTSVDVGPLFGTLLARLVAQAWRVLGAPTRMDLVEAGAGNGRLACDVFDALARDERRCYEAVRLTLIERSQAAREAQPDTLAAHAGQLAARLDELPWDIHGLIYANELLDAFPVHRVRMTRAGLRELYVDRVGDRLQLVEGPPSTPRLHDYFQHLNIALAPGTTADVSLAAVDWCARASRSLRRGFLLLLDYGHAAPTLYGEPGTGGTLRAYSRHLVDAPPSPTSGTPPPVAGTSHDADGVESGSEHPSWLTRPGQQDLTADVNFTAVERALTHGGLRRHAFVDQFRFLLALGLPDLLQEPPGEPPSLGAIRQRLVARTLVSPEGLGGSHRALLMATAGVAALGFRFEAPWPSRGA
jgi:SAM-dependent MidA family methyltransferase